MGFGKITEQFLIATVAKKKWEINTYLTQGYVRVDANRVKFEAFVLSKSGLKSEIRISKLETISKFEYPPAMHYQRYKVDSL